MFARIEVPKTANLNTANLDTAIREFRARFDKVSEVYYPQKDAKGRKGYGDFLMADPIQKWDFISQWCEIYGDEDNPPTCEVSVGCHQPKLFVKFAKHFPKLLDLDDEFTLSQSIYHRQKLCSLHFSLDKVFAGETELEFDIRETMRKTKSQKSSPAMIESALRDLWEPAADQFSKCSSLTIIPKANGTTFKATRSDVKFRLGNLIKPIKGRDEVIELVNDWAKWSCKLPQSIKVMDWHFSCKVPESESLKVYQLFRKLVDTGTWLSFTGKYRKDFKIDSVIGKFPKEGYWRFPLFRATAGLAGAHELVELVLTPNGNFLEYGPMSDSHVEKFKKHTKFKSGCTLHRDQYGCTSGTKTLQELFDED